MPENNKTENLKDDLIREALDRDFESIKTPPADKCWRRIEAELCGQQHLRQSRVAGWPWTLYAAAAAAVLLAIALGSLGIIQMTDFASPMVEEEAPAEEVPVRAADEEMVALEVEEDVEAPPEEANDVELFAEEETVSDEEELVSELPPFEMAVDTSPPKWEASLNDELLFEEAVLLNAGDGPDYQAAIYRGEEEMLIWIKSTVEEERTANFIENFGEHIRVEPLQIEVVNGYIYFEVAGQPGLAWLEDDQNQALVVISGSVSLEQLEKISADLD